MRVLVAALLVLLLAGAASACPNCKESVDDRSAQGFAYAIYLMLGTLFTFTGGIIWMVVKAARRSEAAAAEFIASGSGDQG